MSFVKRHADANVASVPRGCTPSAWGGGWPMTGMGVGHFEVALGTLCVLVEDEPTTFHRQFLSLFVAEGVAHNHALGLLPGRALIERVPANLRHAERDRECSGDALRIAWRYRERPSQQAQYSSSGSGSSVYDLSLYDDTRRMLRALDTLALLDDTSEVHRFLAACRSRGDGSAAARLAIRSLHQYFAGDDHDDDDGDHDGHDADPSRRDAQQLQRRLVRFCHRLRLGARLARAAVLVTVSKAHVTPALLHVADHVIDVNTFGGRGTSAAGLGDYAGLLTTLKAPRVPVSLRPIPCRQGTGVPYVFRRGRRRLHMEAAHEAPAETEAGGEAASVAAAGSGRGGERGVEF